MTDAAEQLTRTMPAHSRDRAKWLKLRALPVRDAQDPRIVKVATALRTAAGDSTSTYIVLAHALARDAIKYVSDTARTGGEDIAGITRKYVSSYEVIERGADDCDGKARLLCALLLAVGLPAKLADWWDRQTGDLAHVGVEVHDAGRWRHLETILSRARYDEEPASVPVEVATGRWRYA